MACLLDPLTAQTAREAEHPTIEEITVIGRFPGPPLWKVSSGEHALWIFGDLTPVPKGLTWDPRNAQRIVERADAVIGPMRIRAPTYNPIKIFRALRAARRLARNPEGSTLKDVLPADLYARYDALRQKHMPDDKRGEDLRPALAVLRLHGAALDDVGLTLDTGVMKTVERLMKRSDAEEVQAKVETEAATVLRELEKVTREAELNCFATTLTTLETDLDGMKERAQAWAIGDVDALERFDYPDAQGDCLEMLFSSSGLKDLGDELFAKWLGEAEHALATYDTTFTVLPMRELVAADGLLAQLAAKGYTVTTP
ncbi:MAG TPA: TraB/GumN family protein [Gammaproteobacteria bacterium]|nr:TraB/GumN family protein [Gammaproteobacteria bacterium]